MPPAAAEVRALTVRFPRFQLGPLDLRIEEGERVALIGRNGAGKSTLMSVLGAHRWRFEGDAVVLGHDARREGVAVRGSVGFLPERAGGFGWMTVAERLRFLSAFFPAWDGDLEAELTERLLLDPLARVGTLSKGNRVKVGLVGALAHRPRFVLLDEPTSGIDPFLRTELLEAIAGVQEEAGSAVLLSTHLLEDAAAFADRALVLEEGRLRADLKRPDDGAAVWNALAAEVHAVVGHA